MAESTATITKYSLQAIATVAALAFFVAALFFMGTNPTVSFTAVDGSTGSATCSSAWNHLFHSDEYTNPTSPITLTSSANGTDDPTFAAYNAADTACGGSIGTRREISGFLLIGGVVSTITAIVQKRRASKVAVADAS